MFAVASVASGIGLGTFGSNDVNSATTLRGLALPIPLDHKDPKPRDRYCFIRRGARRSRSQIVALQCALRFAEAYHGRG